MHRCKGKYGNKEPIQKYTNAEDYANARLEELEEDIKPTASIGTRPKT